MDNKQLQREIEMLKREMTTLRSVVFKKTGLSSAQIRGVIVDPSTVSATIGANSVAQSSMQDSSVGSAELKYELVSVTVSAGNPSGTGTATSGSVIIGWRPTGNIDAFVDNIAISGTTVTVTLGANATADNTFVVILIKT